MVLLTNYLARYIFVMSECEVQGWRMIYGRKCRPLTALSPQRLESLAGSGSAAPQSAWGEDHRAGTADQYEFAYRGGTTTATSPSAPGAREDSMTAEELRTMRLE